MAVSANTLFHFTEKEKLKGILKNYFNPQYSLEELSNVMPKSEVYFAYIPMICFCDLLFYQIKNHIDFYGDYGIGLQKKGWGIEKGISPIVYVPKKSISATFIQVVGHEIATLFKKKRGLKTIPKLLPDFFKYIKAYDGKAFNRKTKKREYRIFYDEREWRYVPNGFQVIEEKHISKSSIEMGNNNMRRSKKLIFKAKHIKYIVVKNENEIPEFVDFIEKKLTKQFSRRERKLLVSKLISVENINDDMS